VINKTEEKTGISGEIRYRFKGIFGSLVFVLFMAVVHFGSAGTLDWPMAWVLLIIYGAGFVVMTLAMSKELIEERNWMIRKANNNGIFRAGFHG